MCSLSNRPGPEGDFILPGEDENSDESIGWDDDADAPTNLDVYIKDKDLNSSLIRLANEKVSLAKILSNYHIDFKQQYSPSGWTHTAVCPFKDHQDSTPSFGYNSKEDRFNCFGCSRGGRAVQFLSYMEGRPQIEIAKGLLEKTISADEIIAEIEVIDSKVQEALFAYAEMISDFVDKHDQSNHIIKYVDAITWPLDAYIRNHLPSGTIDLAQLEARLKICKDRLDNYGDENE